MDQPSAKPVLILGVGNTLLKDEGVGVHVARRLQDMDLPEEVEVLEGGVLGLDLLDFVEGRQKVIVIDAVKGDRTPGTIYRMKRDDIEMGQTRCLSSLHDIDLPFVLRSADLMGIHVDPVIIGVEPKDLSLGYDELSPEIEVQIPHVIDLVMQEIKKASNF